MLCANVKNALLKYCAYVKNLCMFKPLSTLHHFSITQMELLQVLSKKEKNRRENTAIVEEAEQEVNKDSTHTARSDCTAKAKDKPKPPDSLTSSC